MSKHNISPKEFAEILSGYTDLVNYGSAPPVDDYLEKYTDQQKKRLKPLLEMVSDIREYSVSLSFSESKKDELFKKIKNNLSTDLTGVAVISDVQRPDFLLLTLKITSEMWGITKLTKILFLVGKEAVRSEKRFDFYNHYAYDYGPFDDAIKKDLDALKEFKMIEEGLPPANENLGAKQIDAIFRLTESGRKYVEEFEKKFESRYPDVLKEIFETVKKYNSMKLDPLLKYVYKTYPELTKKSKIKKQVLGSGDDKA